MLTGLRSCNSNFHNQLILISAEYLYSSKLRSTSLVVWFSTSRRELKNVVSKSRLESLFLSNRLRVRNKQKTSSGLELVDWWPKDLSDKACLNILRVEDVKHVGVRLSTKQNYKASIQGDDRVGIKRGNKASIEKDNKIGIGERDNKPGIGGQDDKSDIRRQDDNELSNLRWDNKVGIRRQDNKKVFESVARAFYIRVQRLLYRVFFSLRVLTLSSSFHLQSP